MALHPLAAALPTVVAACPGAASALISALAAHPATTSVVHAGCTVLRPLAACPASASSLAAASTVAALSGALRALMGQAPTGTTSTPPPPEAGPLSEGRLRAMEAALVVIAELVPHGRSKETLGEFTLLARAPSHDF